jgi:hypothetical protein
MEWATKAKARGRASRVTATIVAAGAIPARTTKGAGGKDKGKGTSHYDKGKGKGKKGDYGKGKGKKGRATTIRARAKEKGRATTIRAKAKVRRGTTAKVTMAKVAGIPVVTTTTRDTGKVKGKARAKSSPPMPLRIGQLGAHPRGRFLATWERGGT